MRFFFFPLEGGRINFQLIRQQAGDFFYMKNTSGLAHPPKFPQCFLFFFFFSKRYVQFAIGENMETALAASERTCLLLTTKYTPPARLNSPGEASLATQTQAITTFSNCT